MKSKPLELVGILLLAAVGIGFHPTHAFWPEKLSVFWRLNSPLQEEWFSVVERDVGMRNDVQSKKKQKRIVPQNIRNQDTFPDWGSYKHVEECPKKTSGKVIPFENHSKTGNILEKVLSWPHRERNTSNFHDFITFRAAASTFKNVLYNIPDVSSKEEHLSSIFIRAVYQPIFCNQKGILLNMTERKQFGRWLTAG